MYRQTNRQKETHIFVKSIPFQLRIELKKKKIQITFILNNKLIYVLWHAYVEVIFEIEFSMEMNF